MRRSFLVHFRGTDGRSLARALACLILINAFFVGFLGGTAAASPDAAICTVAFPGVDAASDPDTPASGHAFDCCPGLCSVAGSALPPATPAMVQPTAKPAAATLAPAIAEPAPAGRANPARGPPVLA